MKLIITQKPPVTVTGTSVVTDTVGQTVQNVRKDTVITAYVEDEKVEAYIREQTALGRVCHTFSYDASFRAEINVVPYKEAA